MKTLCIYVLSEYTLNVEFFLQQGIISHSDIDFYLVITDPDLDLSVPGATVIHKKTDDFGAWSHILLPNDFYKNYHYFILLNSSVRGPFLPHWSSKRWPDIFTEQITHDIKLLGLTISNTDSIPYVESSVLITDVIGLEIGINGEIFKNTNQGINYSTAILQAGYNIGCMLKAYRGIDFRVQKNYRGTSFLSHDYYGTTIHPYETIFCPTSSGQLRIDDKLIDLYTDWNSGSARKPSKMINWVHYLINNPDLIKAGILTKPEALKHYMSYGIYEGRSPIIPMAQHKYYVLDLYSSTTNSLIEQMYSLITGILIGHFVGRNIILSGFYTHRGQNVQSPIDHIIDIPRLNLLLNQLQLTTQVSSVNLLPQEFKTPMISSAISTYYNPIEIFQDQGFIDTLIKLKSETTTTVTLGDTFSDWLFPHHDDRGISRLFKKILAGIKFTPRFYKIVETRKPQNPYKVIHFGLEDNTLSDEALINIIDKYKEKLSTFANSNDSVYLSSSNSKYVDMLVTDELRSHYPRLIIGTPEEEIDAIIDYLICIQGTDFLGHHLSYFSEAITYNFQIQDKPYHDINDKETISDTLPFKVEHFQVFYGTLGLGGSLGYNENGITSVGFDQKNIHSLSAHAPSKVIIKTIVPLVIKGYCSPTAITPPTMHFWCDDQLLGKISIAGKFTPAIIIAPGIHKLKIVTSVKEYAHSVWLLSFSE